MSAQPIGTSPVDDARTRFGRRPSSGRIGRLVVGGLAALPASALVMLWPGTASQAATPPTPTYATATVDGDASEWDLANDLYAAMYNAGNPSDPVLANGYLRYDCTTGTLYAMVEQASYNGALVPLLNSSYQTGNAWAELNGGNTKVYTDASGTNPSHTPPEFAWFGTGYDGNSSHSQGYEASFAIAPGSYTIVLHVEASYNNAASTAGFVGFNTHTTSQTVALDIPDSCTNSGGSGGSGGGPGGGGSGGGGSGGGGTPSNPAIAVTKYLDGSHYAASPGAELAVGSTIAWTYDLSNTGDVDLSAIGVTDDQGVIVTCPSATLPVGQSETCTGSSEATAGQYTNTATASGTAPDSTVVTAQDSSYYYGVSDPQLSGPTPSDPAVTSYTRTYSWSMAKSVNTTSITKSSGTASFDYTVQAAETGFADSAWQLAGEVALTNPNATDLSGVTVTDAVDTGGTCAVASGSGVAIPAGSTVTLDYTCTWSTSPTASSGTDTATATWDPVANHTPNSTATVDTPFAFGSPTTRVDAGVTVSDSLAGTLGTLTALDSIPYTSGTYNYTLGFAVPSSGCQSHPNTATIVETGQSASKTVDVCGSSSSTSGPGPGGFSTPGPGSSPPPDPSDPSTPDPTPPAMSSPPPADPSPSAVPDPSAAQAAIPGATTVHAGMPFAGSERFVLAALGLGSGLVAVGLRRRRRTT